MANSSVIIGYGERKNGSDNRRLFSNLDDYLLRRDALSTALSEDQCRNRFSAAGTAVRVLPQAAVSAAAKQKLGGVFV
ncbi:MAG: hypothetical protein K8R46_11835 [Pirellulales bacterium]|nr:hypothetical protein [Pirellulales bacterium]